MKKVRFDNYSSGAIFLTGNPVVDIPGHAFGDKHVVAELPESKRTEALLQYLASAFPALVITDPFVEDEASASPGEGDGDKGADEGAGDEGDTAMTLEAFTAQAKIEEKGSGWFVVTVEGVEPAKVRVTKDSKPAVEQAYALYCGTKE